jgi:dTDP-4-amino-4,6-dideoxygalactose transaminase
MDEIKTFVEQQLANKPIQTEFIAGVTPIGIADAQLGKEEVEALVRASLDLRIVDGKITHSFEFELAKFLGVRYATCCNSGSSANLLAFMALTSPKLGSRAIVPGDEVIVCAVGFPTTVAPVIQAGAIPVFVDISLVTYNPTPKMIAEAITDKTKAIFLAHTLGNPFDLDAIREIAWQNELWLIEDNADAFGSEYDGKKTGTIGDISTTSFYPAHMMTTGEGGAVFTDNAMLNQIVRSLRDWGRECWCLPNKDNTCGKRFTQKDQGELPDCFDHKYIYSHIGYNLKTTDLQASMGLEQLKKLPSFIERRRHNWQFLRDTLVGCNLDDYFLMPKATPKSNPAWFGFLLTIKKGMPFTRKELLDFLSDKKIATRNLFGGNLTKQPAFLGKGRIADELTGTLPKADSVMENTFFLGCHPGVTEPMIDWMADCLVEFTDKFVEIQ